MPKNTISRMLSNIGLEGIQSVSHLVHITHRVRFQGKKIIPDLQLPRRTANYRGRVWEGHPVWVTKLLALRVGPKP